MVLNFYSVLLIISIINLFALIYIGRKQNISVYIMLYITITINLIGHYIISKSMYFETALGGHRLVYVGAVFCPTLWLFGVAKLCKIKVPKCIIAGLMACSAIVLYLAYNVGTQTFYYTSITLGKYNNYTVLVKENGPLHILYPLLIVGNLLGIIGILIYCNIWKKNVSRRISLLLLFMNIFTAAIYFAERAIDIPYEMYNVAYILVEFCVLILIRRIGMYDISENVAISLEEKSNYGYIILDKQYKYMGSNLTAGKFLPEITEVNIDSPLSAENAPTLYAKFERWVSAPEIDFKFTINTDERHLSCSIKNIKNGYIIELIDDTHQHKYIELLNSYNTTLEDEVTAKTERIEILQDNLILGMSDMIESRDSNTGGHVKRSSLAVRIFVDELRKNKEQYGFNEQFFRNIIKAAPMHDLGTIFLKCRPQLEKFYMQMEDENPSILILDEPFNGL